MKGTRITTTARGTIHPLACQGILVPDCYAQIADLLRSRLGDAHVLLFAEPVFDNEREIVDWYTPVHGSPVPLAELEPETQQRIRTRFSSMAEDIRACIQPLRAVGDPRRRMAGDILDLALQYPDDSCLFVVGEQAVVVCWGCGPATQGVEPQNLSRLGGPIRAQATAPAQPAAPSFTPPVEPIPPTSPPSLPSSGEPSPRRIWPWLLLLLFLLLLVLGYLYSRGELTRFGLPAGCAPVKQLEKTEPAPSTPEGPSVLVVPSEQDHLQARIDQLKLEIETLRADLAERRALCRPASPAPEALIVPSDLGDTKDMRFIEGSWECATGLQDSQARPVVVTYTFGRDGSGTVNIDGSNEQCTSKAKAGVAAEGHLLIETEGEILCPSGSAYRGQSISCTGVGEQTRCEGRNIHGTTVWRADFSRKE